MNAGICEPANKMPANLRAFCTSTLDYLVVVVVVDVDGEVVVVLEGDIVVMLDGAVSEVKAAHAGRTVAVAFDGAPSPAVDAVLRDTSLVANMDDQNRFLELELAPGASSGMLLAQLVAVGARLQRFERVQPSLHRIFLEKVGATGVEAGMSGHG